MMRQSNQDSMPGGNTHLLPRDLAAIFLSALLLMPSDLCAQQQPGQAAKPSAAPAASESSGSRRLAPGALRIGILEGQNVINSLTTRTAVSPVVQVFDYLEQPVEGAEVTFEVPPTGPGGTFPNQQNIITTRTDVRGQATAAFTPNNTPGSFTIKVTASAGGQSAEARLVQTNDNKAMFAGPVPPPKAWYKNWKWWAVIGAGAGAGIAAAVILTGRNDAATITISPGTVVIGGPR